MSEIKLYLITLNFLWIKKYYPEKIEYDWTYPEKIIYTHFIFRKTNICVFRRDNLWGNKEKIIIKFIEYYKTQKWKHKTN